MISHVPDLRHLFIRLLHRETDADSLAMVCAFLQAAIEASAPWASLPQPPHFPGQPPRQLTTTLRWHAPTALLQWDWLRSISHAAAGGRPANTALFAAYLDAVGLHDPTQSLAAQYRALLVQAGLQLPALNHLADDPGLPQAVLIAPCLALSLSHFPSRCFGEILGYTLAHCQASHIWLDWLEQQLQTHGLATGYCRRYRELLAKHQAPLLATLAAYGDQPGVDSGHALYRHGQQTFITALNQELTTPPCPARLAEAMLRRKRPFALGHHGRIKLQDKTLDQWLAEDDLAALRLALRQSPHITRPLFQSMEFGGPMFGVFSDEEQRHLRAWLEKESRPPEDNSVDLTSRESSFRQSLPRSEPAPVMDCRGNAGEMPESRAMDGAYGRRPTYLFMGPLVVKVSARELYHRLLNRESHPDSLPSAARYVETVLSRTQLLAPLQAGLKRRFAYSAEIFKQRVDAIYQQEMARYRPLSGPPKLPRELYIWGITQMAPAILLDGCWLENLAGAEPALDEVHRLLLQTFADEVGYGHIERNHPNIYRRLLQSLDIQLPPASSREFAQHPQMYNAAFTLPTYLLSIGLWPERFFPEILGLNLAIELSGLGADYMRLIDALRYYGIDPSIIQLHLSVDNLASGHAALARDAIALHLEQVQTLGGQTALAPAWQRVWTGYLSLTSASLPFAWAGLRQYGQWRMGAISSLRGLMLRGLRASRRDECTQGELHPPKIRKT